MMGVCSKPGRNIFQQLFFHGEYSVSTGKTGAVGYTEDMCVYRDGLVTKGRVKYYIRGLSADAGQRLKLSAGSGYATLISLLEDVTGFKNVIGFTVKKAYVPYVFFDAGETQFNHFLRSGGDAKKGSSRFVYRDIGCLGRENHRNQELKSTPEFKLCLGIWIFFRQTRKKLDPFCETH